MKFIPIFVYIFFLISGCTVNNSIKSEQKISNIPKILNGTWNLKIENSQHKDLTTAIVSFSSEKANSCIGGNWKKLIVKSYKINGKQVFPITEPLSYELDKNKLTIGRNEICDGYLHLSGDLNNSKVIGNYYTFSINGVTNLGRWYLTPQ